MSGDVIRHVAFLRGVNVGGRTLKSADLQAAFADMGFAGARPLLASGNVMFDAAPTPELARRIEVGLEARFGFAVGTVIRTQAALRAMIATNPFAGIDREGPEKGPDRAKFYVALLGSPMREPLSLPYGVKGDFDVVKVSPCDIFIVAWRMDNGRYGAGLDKLDTALGRVGLVTLRNWNTIIKAAA